jgi:hypothetical protein
MLRGKDLAELAEGGIRDQGSGIDIQGSGTTAFVMLGLLCAGRGKFYATSRKMDGGTKGQGKQRFREKWTGLLRRARLDVVDPEKPVRVG